MKRIGAYKTRTAFVMAFVLGCQLLTGTGLFCASQFLHASRSVGNDQTTIAGSTAEPENISRDAVNNGESQSGTVPCSCKKKKKCPAIPRVTLTLSPTEWFNEIQSHFKSVCGDYVAPAPTCHRFALGSAPPFMESAGDTQFFSSTPLLNTCVLLI